MRGYPYLFLACAALLAAGCDASDPVEQPDVLMPLEIGNTWEYRITRTMPEEPAVEGTMRWEIEGTSIIGREEYTVLQPSWSGPFDFADTLVTFHRNTGEGLATLFNFASALFIFRYPVESDTWYTMSGSGIQGSANLPLPVHVTRERVTVPAGSFESVVYTITIPFGDQRVDAYAPRVGLVRREQGPYLTELVDYTPR